MRFLLILGILSAAVASAVAPWPVMVGMVILVMVVAILVRNLDAGLMILIFLYPLLGLVIDFSKIEWFRNLPLFSQVDAPLVNLFALPLLLAWFIASWRGWFRLRTYPYLLVVLPFFISAVLSLRNVPVDLYSISQKYILHPLIFFYLVFVLLPVSIIRSESSVRRAMVILYGMGIAAAFMGLLSLGIMPPDGFPRATPFAIFGIAPLGTNHNLLSEVLVATAPAGLALFYFYTNQRARRWIITGILFQGLIALLTFGRTAWIVIALELAAYAFFMQRARWRSLLRITGFVALLSIPLAVIMFAFSSSELVQGSTLTRLDMIRIAWFHFLRNPWLGQGPGTFLPLLSENRAFILDYGTPLDAHGVLWKLMFEQGTLGIVTFFSMVGFFLYVLWGSFQKLRAHPEAQVLCAAALMATGAVVFQLFNTQYYSSKLWLPMGVALATARFYSSRNHTPAV